MERLSTEVSATYNPIEAAIHVARYSLAFSYCKGRRILDLACGEGYGSWLLKNAGAAEVVGVDISEKAIDVARRQYRAEGLSFIQGDGNDLLELLGDQKFDMVVSIETIEHVSDPSSLLKDIKTVSTQDAIIIITCPNDYWYYGEERSNPFHLRKFRFDEFRDLSLSVLGTNVHWAIGTGVLGFASLRVDDNGALLAGSQHSNLQSPNEWVNTKLLDAGVAVEGEKDQLSHKNCSYFVGFWNLPKEPIGASAIFPLSMDDFGGKLAGKIESLYGAAARESIELQTLRAQARALKIENNILIANRHKEITEFVQLNLEKELSLERKNAQLMKKNAKLKEKANLGYQLQRILKKIARTPQSFGSGRV